MFQLQKQLIFQQLLLFLRIAQIPSTVSACQGHHKKTWMHTQALVPPPAASTSEKQPWAVKLSTGTQISKLSILLSKGCWTKKSHSKLFQNHNCSHPWVFFFFSSLLRLISTVHGNLAHGDKVIMERSQKKKNLPLFLLPKLRKVQESHASSEWFQHWNSG